MRLLIPDPTEAAIARAARIVAEQVAASKPQLTSNCFEVHPAGA